MSGEWGPSCLNRCHRYHSLFSPHRTRLLDDEWRAALLDQRARRGMTSLSELVARDHGRINARLRCWHGAVATPDDAPPVALSVELWEAFLGMSDVGTFCRLFFAF